MQNENQVAQVPPSSPISIQSGISTSSGQFTALFALAALALSALGFHYSSDQVQSWFTLANNIAITLGPLFGIIPVLMNYVNSRGKIASNAIVTQGQVAAAHALAKGANNV